VPPCERDGEKVKPSPIYKTRPWGSDRLPQGGKSSLPLPRGLGVRCCCRRHGHRRTPSRLSSARRRLRCARRLYLGCLAAGTPAPAPGAVSSTASAALGEGAKDPISRGEPVPHRSPPPRSTTSTPKSLGRRAHAARAAGTPYFSIPSAPVAGSSSPSCAPPALAPAAAPRARSGSGHGLVGPRDVHGHHLQGVSETPGHNNAPRIDGPKRDGNPLTKGP
jgi:hypothetical protein